MQGIFNPETASTPPALPQQSSNPQSSNPRARNALSALRLFVVMLSLALLSRFFVVVPAGERGVLMRFGAVEERILQEGIHPLLPLIYSVKTMSVRVHTLTMQTEAASRDLQDVGAELAVNWHIEPDRVNRLYQRLGDSSQIARSVIQPAIEDGIKAVLASFTAEALVTERAEVKAALETVLSARFHNYDLVLDDVDLLQVDFSQRFREAVEAKQVAEQEAKRAEFEAVRAQRMAEARVFQAKGEAQAQQLLQAGLTPQMLEHQAIEKWNGHLPLVMGNDAVARFDFKSLLKADRQRSH
jgi:regulator of protease activity HflC (stomatin/prohibitin superfamily)